MVFELCSTVIRLSSELVAKCSQQPGVTTSRQSILAADLHACSFLMPLTKHALTSLRYPQLSGWHKRFAWHTARRLADAFCAVLPVSPAPQAAVVVRSTSSLAPKLASGQPLLLRDDAQTDGGEGELQLVVTLDPQASEQGAVRVEEVTTSEQRAISAYSEVVLPWAQTPDPHAIDSVLNDARRIRQDRQLLVVGTASVPPQGSPLQEVTAAVEHIVGTLRQMQPQSEVAAEVLGEAAAELAASAARVTGKSANLSNEALELRTQLHNVLTALPARANSRLAEKLRATGVAGARRYAAGQLLTVCVRGEWHDMEVVSAPSMARGEHRLRSNDTSAQTPPDELSCELTPWNHAPRQLPSADFESVRGRYERSMQAQHASIVDALSGMRLDVLKQCMPIEVKEEATGDGGTSVGRLSKVKEVQSLAMRLHEWHARQWENADATERACVLLTALPATGKTCLMSQVVMHSLRRETMPHTPLVPILVKMQQLQRLLTGKDAAMFAHAWNWIDAYLRITHGEESDLYRFLRQVHARAWMDIHTWVGDNPDPCTLTPHLCSSPSPSPSHPVLGLDLPLSPLLSPSPPPSPSRQPVPTRITAGHDGAACAAAPRRPR